MFGLFFINTFANLIALIHSSHNLNVVYLASVGVNAIALPQTAQRIALLVSHNFTPQSPHYQEHYSPY